MTPPNVQFIPAAGGGTDWADHFVAGSGYWIIPPGTSTVNVNKTGGDGSTNFSVLRKGSNTGSIVTSQSGTVSMNGVYYFIIQGGYNQLLNPYQFCATWCDGAGGYRLPQAPGWVIWETETNPGSVVSTAQTFAPVEVQSGVVGGTTTSSGYGPLWNASLYDATLVFFFNSYTPGAVQTWTAWDGTSTP